MSYRDHHISIMIISFLFIILDSSIQVKAQSITGRDWIKAAETSSFSPRAMQQIIEFKGKLLLIGGIDNNGNLYDVWRSEDGINWSLLKENIGPIFVYGSKAVVKNDTIWLNTEKDIWNSIDGITWNRIATINEFPRYGKNMLVFKNKIWITGGANVINENTPTAQVVEYNDVWSSPDGINWKKESTINCFTKRADHSVAVFNNKMWVIAGQSGYPNPNKNDVWCSDDGISWNKVTSAPFSSRHMTQAIAFDNKLWVIAGFTQDNRNQPIVVSDVWSSSDGKNWEQVTTSAPFSKRQEHQAFIFNNKLWLIGGYCGNLTETPHIYKNDIWYTETSSTDIKNNIRPESYSLFQNYPNPFNPETVIGYRLSVISFVTLKIYNILGNEVTTLVNEEQPIGNYEVKFSANNLSSGIYFYKLNAGNYSEIKKMILMR